VANWTSSGSRTFVLRINKIKLFLNGKNIEKYKQIKYEQDACYIHQNNEQENLVRGQVKVK